MLRILAKRSLAAAADRFVVIADSTKVVDALTAPIPLELLEFGLDAATLRKLDPVTLRDVPKSPDGGVIADYAAPWVIRHCGALVDATPGVVGHGLFPPEMVSMVLVGRGESVDRTDFQRVVTDPVGRVLRRHPGSGRRVVRHHQRPPASTRPAGMVGHPRATGGGPLLSPPVTSHRICRCRASAGYVRVIRRWSGTAR